MDNTYNLRNPQEGEVQEMHSEAKRRVLARQKYKVLSQILSNKKEVDITVSPEIFEALNRERMEFEALMRLPKNEQDVKDCLEETKVDREKHDEGRYWNRQSPAKWGCLGHIPKCCYYARPPEYWKDKNILREFFNSFPKFRISSKPL